MSMTKQTKLAILEVHRDNLKNSKTFEEYREHHVAYCDFLIEQVKAHDAEDEAAFKFIWRTLKDVAEQTKP